MSFISGGGNSESLNMDHVKDQMFGFLLLQSKFNLG